VPLALLALLLAAAPAEPMGPTPAAPTPALIEKLGAGDRAFLSGDLRTALFAYQDAAYLDSTSAVARIRLARAYVALGHKDQAQRQLRQAAELDPGSVDAGKLLETLSGPAPDVPSPGPARPPGPAPPVRAGPPSPRSYRFSEDAGEPRGPAAPPPGGPTASEAQPASLR
jgi:tetratricopeptide (TPR) repeat protein